MVDLNDLRVFERVGILRSFSAAAQALGLPKSNVSRSVARLEAARTTREVSLTPAGESLMSRSLPALASLTDALDYVGSLSQEPRGLLRISAGITFGIDVLADQLPFFLARHPQVEVCLDLTSRPADLVADRIDVAVRVGPLGDSSIVAVRLGEMKRLLCAAPSYLERRGTPRTPDDLKHHDGVELPGVDGHPRSWTFHRAGETVEVSPAPRMQVNEALTINRLVANGAGIGVISSYICVPQIRAGELIHLLPAWDIPPLVASLVFPSRRELSPTVRAFVDFMKEVNPPGLHWLNNEAP